MRREKPSGNPTAGGARGLPKPEPLQECRIGKPGEKIKKFGCNIRKYVLY